MPIIPIRDIERTTPGEAIRRHCRECVCDQYDEIKNCTASVEVCKLYPYRRGVDRNRGERVFSRLKTIRRECVACMGGSSESVKDCPSTGCALWQFRLGKGRCFDPTGETWETRPRAVAASGILQADFRATSDERGPGGVRIPG